MNTLFYDAVRNLLAFAIAAQHLYLFSALKGDESAFTVVFDVEYDGALFFLTKFIERCLVGQRASQHMPEVLKIMLVLQIDFLLFWLFYLLFYSIQMLDGCSL